MSRLRTLAQAAKLDPRVGVAGFPEDVADDVLELALAGKDAEAIVGALGRRIIQTTWARRPLAVTDVQEIVTFARQARGELVLREAEAARARESCEQLRAALEPTPAPPPAGTARR